MLCPHLRGLHRRRDRLHPSGHAAFPHPLRHRFSTRVLPAPRWTREHQANRGGVRRSRARPTYVTAGSCRPCCRPRSIRVPIRLQPPPFVLSRPDHAWCAVSNAASPPQICVLEHHPGGGRPGRRFGEGQARGNGRDDRAVVSRIRIESGLDRRTRTRSGRQRHAPEPLILSAGFREDCNCRCANDAGVREAKVLRADGLVGSAICKETSERWRFP